ncbi:MAG: hypothetical protein P8Y97_02940 [Candidatus Lokiarchaeota archaeon]
MNEQFKDHLRTFTFQKTNHIGEKREDLIIEFLENSPEVKQTFTKIYEGEKQEIFLIYRFFFSLFRFMFLQVL